MSLLIRSFVVGSVLLGGLALPPAPEAADDDDPGARFERTSDIIYGRKHGTALTFDLFRPTHDDGQGQGLGLIFVVSGGWFSAHEAIPLPLIEPLLDRGYTVFAVVHGSQPKFTIPEILTDMHRAVRFIRHHADEYGVDPDRLGIFGGSAGGHLSLMQGVAGDSGDPDATDPIDRESSRVQAVACLFPPTDFLNYGEEGNVALGRNILSNFRAPFDFHELDATKNVYVPITDEGRVLQIGRDISPVSHVSDDDPPTLIVHGDADALVPIQQAEVFLDALKPLGVPSELIVKPGAGHGWPDLPADLSHFADWFDRHLADSPAP